MVLAAFFTVSLPTFAQDKKGPLADQRCRSAVKGEVVLLDGGADRAGDYGLDQGMAGHRRLHLVILRITQHQALAMSGRA
jgi:hypothetical protein